MYLNQSVEHMKVNRWILLQMSNHNHFFQTPVIYFQEYLKFLMK